MSATKSFSGIVKSGSSSAMSIPENIPTSIDKAIGNISSAVYWCNLKRQASFMFLSQNLLSNSFDAQRRRIKEALHKSLNLCQRADNASAEVVWRWRSSERLHR